MLESCFKGNHKGAYDDVEHHRILDGHVCGWPGCAGPARPLWTGLGRPTISDSGCQFYFIQHFVIGLRD